MQASDLRPASDFANRFGCKSVIYGPPGSAKTPTVSTCPRPILLATEPGLLSMRGSNVPTYQAFDSVSIDGFFKWFFGSNETKNYDTLAVDSISQIAEIYLQEALGKKTSGGNQAHGLKAYGEMASKTMEILRGLYFSQQKHLFLIAKEGSDNNNGILMRKPYFPGNALGFEVPHLFDFVLRLAVVPIPGVGEQKAFQCNASYDVSARNRTGNLADFEPPHFGQLVTKALS